MSSFAHRATSRGFAGRALAPIQRFLKVEAASGIVLMVAAAIALAWANSPAHGSYVALWHLQVPLRVGSIAFERDVHFWINDGLMTLFFFVVGLEIRREMHGGELSELRRAALPLVAALGGMLMPATIYAVINHSHGAHHGWGIPMATDIAFAVGVLALLGKRVPPALRILLLALAVIDDVGAILVIALFYASGFEASGFVVIAAGVAGIFGLRRLGVRQPWAYVPTGVLVWAGAYRAGIHPTLAGVVLGMLTPVLARDGEKVSPLERIEQVLHNPVAFGVMPLFALANAGVRLGSANFDGDGLYAFLGVFLGLCLGKPLGVLGISWIFVKVGGVVLPRGVTFRHLTLVGLLAGIGFTMALFIAQLAFAPGADALETSKLGILAASGLTAVLGFALGRAVLPPTFPADAAQDEVTAERSTSE
jgi:NhaA family Na+:H+ antiporter